LDTDSFSDACVCFRLINKAVFKLRAEYGDMSIASADFRNPMYPNYGELWGYAGRVAIIATNTIEIGKTIWVMDRDSGDEGYARLEDLILLEDRNSMTLDEVVALFTAWAKDGRSAAMWWLGWWFEGTNHARSVWYYIAALRANPAQHSWAAGRIISDAYTASMCKGYPKPNLDFLNDIPEITTRKLHVGLWEQALNMALSAKEVEKILVEG